MKVGDLVKIWYDHETDESYNIPPVRGIILETTVFDDEILDDTKRKLHCIYVNGRAQSYWEPDWMFEVINEAR